MRTREVLLLTGTLLVANGCISPKPGLQRTQFEKWEHREISEVGISFEVPQHKQWAGPSVGGWYEPNDNPKIVVMSMHYLHPATIGDSLALIRVAIYRLKPEMFASYEKGQAGDKVKEEFFKLGSFLGYQSSLKVERLAYPRFQGAEFLCFRKDYKAANGDVILAGAEIFPALLKPPYPESQQADDRKAVERILNSIRFTDTNAVEKATTNERSPGVVAMGCRYIGVRNPCPTQGYVRIIRLGRTGRSFGIFQRVHGRPCHRGELNYDGSLRLL